jgi:hypothetical protein
VVEAAVSFRIAMETNIWFVPNEKSYIWYAGPASTPPSPGLTYPLWYFDWFYDHYCSSEQYFVNLFPANATMVVDYRDMISGWDQIISAVQTHIGVDPIEIPKMFDKRTQGRIEDLISNYREIRGYYAAHPILASHFKEASESS